MQIIKIKPESYCQGVKRALQMLDNALVSDDYQKPIYVIGEIIHNSAVTKHYQKLGVINITDHFKTNILNKKEGTFLISAHGLNQEIYQYILESGLKYLDTTCIFVKKVQNEILKKLLAGYTIIYIGHKGHPETEAILSLDKNILLSTKETPVMKTDNQKIFVTNQTTLSILDIKDIIDALKTKYPNIVFKNNICLESTKRQLNIMKETAVDLCIIIGDPKSSNTNRLLEVAKAAGLRAVLIQSKDNLTADILKGVKKVSVASGASTPQVLIDDVIEYLKRLPIH